MMNIKKLTNIVRLKGWKGLNYFYDISMYFTEKIYPAYDQKLVKIYQLVA